MSKYYFQFKWFSDLQVGDVFKFCTIIDNDIPSIFYTAYAKDDINTKFSATYGRNLHRKNFANDTPREIMIFPNRKAK
jgi:hypothetical protein